MKTISNEYAYAVDQITVMDQNFPRIVDYINTS